VIAEVRQRRFEDRLLMRELLLRARAERYGAPGQSGAPTEYFLRRKRRVMRRHPHFTLKYLVAKRRRR
jgi:hypothetical protein